jgi:hypothetical protein
MGEDKDAQRKNHKKGTDKQAGIEMKRPRQAVEGLKARGGLPGNEAGESGRRKQDCEPRPGHGVFHHVAADRVTRDPVRSLAGFSRQVKRPQ